MGTHLAEGRHWTEFVLTEANGQRSRENVTVAVSQTIVPGQVLGIVTAGGQVKAWDPAAADGSQNAAGIALYGVTTGAATAKISAIVRDAEVNKNCLSWHGDATGPQITTSTGQLAALGILCR